MLGADIAMAFDHVVPGGRRPSPVTPWKERCDGWNDAPADIESWRMGGSTDRRMVPSAHPTIRLSARPFGPSCRAAPTRHCAGKRSTGCCTPVIGPASPWGACPWGSRSRSCTTCWKPSSPGSPLGCPVILWAWGFPRIWWRRWSAADLPDCVAPTRWPQRTAFTPDGPLNIRNAAHRVDPRRRPHVRLRNVQTFARLPAAPVRRGGAAGPAPLVVAQRPLPDPPHRRNAPGDQFRATSARDRRMAPPLPAPEPA
jgi:hypothetical protein